MEDLRRVKPAGEGLNEQSSREFPYSYPSGTCGVTCLLFGSKLNNAKCRPFLIALLVMSDKLRGGKRLFGCDWVNPRSVLGSPFGAMDRGMVIMRLLRKAREIYLGSSAKSGPGLTARALGKHGAASREAQGKLAMQLAY